MPAAHHRGGVDVLAHSGSFFFYFNNWGSFPGVGFCGTSGGCWSCCFHDCTYFDNHTVVAYRSDDHKSFTPLGVVFRPGAFGSLQGATMF